MIAVAGLLLASCTTYLPYTATNNEIGSKVGTSKTGIIFGTAGYRNLGAGLFVTNKNYGVIEAAKDAGIQKIATVDLKIKDYLKIFKQVEIVVTGE